MILQRSPAQQLTVESETPSPTALHGRQLLIARAAWLAVSALGVGLFVASVPVAYAHFQTVCRAPECLWRLSPENVKSLEELGLSLNFYASYNIALEVVYTLGFCAVGALIFMKRSQEWMPLLLSLALMLAGINTLDILVKAYPEWWLAVAFVGYLGPICFFTSFYLFPDGRFVPRWMRVPAAIWIVSQVPTYFFPDSPFNPNSWPPLFDAVLLLGMLGTLVFAQVYRYVRVSGPIERQQTKWVVFGLTTAIAVFVGVALTGMALLIIRPGELGVLYTFLSKTALYIGFFLVPLSVGVAILRYRLWDIDVIINRTLVYGALTASVVGFYVLVVGGLGALFQSQSNLAVSLLAAGVVAVLFAPLRDRLQRGVNRLMYGERDDPYAVLSRLGRQLETTLAPEAALETVAEAVSQALRLPYTAIDLRQDGEFRRVSEHGTPKGEILTLSLVHQREEVGRMLVSPRAPGENFSPEDERLLEDLARQAGAAAHAARLTADLRRSRERLITAREEERRRLRRDLHDGLGPALGGLTLGLDAARSTLPQGASTSEALLAELKAQTQEAVFEIRRLAHGLRPPALDDLGLVAAIRQQAVTHGHLSASPEGVNLKSGPVFSVEAPENLPPLPAAVEVACYRITQEAITNVSRHARARSCRISLAMDEVWNVLVVEVEDDGVGMPEGRRAGVGMSSMRERAEELGGTLVVEPNPQGGTRVVARLPLPAKEE